VGLKAGLSQGFPQQGKSLPGLATYDLFWEHGRALQCHPITSPVASSYPKPTSLGSLEPTEPQAMLFYPLPYLR